MTATAGSEVAPRSRWRRFSTWPASAQVVPGAVAIAGLLLLGLRAPTPKADEQRAPDHDRVAGAAPARAAGPPVALTSRSDALMLIRAMQSAVEAKRCDAYSALLTSGTHMAADRLAAESRSVLDGRAFLCALAFDRSSWLAEASGFGADPAALLLEPAANGVQLRDGAGRVHLDLVQEHGRLEIDALRHFVPKLGQITAPSDGPLDRAFAAERFFFLTGGRFVDDVVTLAAAAPGVTFVQGTPPPDAVAVAIAPDGSGVCLTTVLDGAARHLRVAEIGLATAVTAAGPAPEPCPGRPSGN